MYPWLKIIFTYNFERNWEAVQKTKWLYNNTLLAKERFRDFLKHFLTYLSKDGWYVTLFLLASMTVLINHHLFFIWDEVLFIIDCVLKYIHIMLACTEITLFRKVCFSSGYHIKLLLQNNTAVEKYNVEEPNNGNKTRKKN